MTPRSGGRGRTSRHTVTCSAPAVVAGLVHDGRQPTQVEVPAEHVRQVHVDVLAGPRVGPGQQPLEGRVSRPGEARAGPGRALAGILGTEGETGPEKVLELLVRLPLEHVGRGRVVGEAGSALAWQPARQGSGGGRERPSPPAPARRRLSTSARRPRSRWPPLPAWTSPGPPRHNMTRCGRKARRCTGAAARWQR